MTVKDEAQELEALIDYNSIPAFDTEPLIEKPMLTDLTIIDPVARKEVVETPDSSQDRKDDYEYARQVYISTIEQGQEVLTGLLEMTAAAPNPKAFEVAGQLMKINSDNADKLMKLAKEYKDLEGAPKAGTEQTADTINNNNIIFKGSPEELLKMLDEEDVIEIED